MTDISFNVLPVLTTPAPEAKNEQTDPPLVQTIIDEKEQLLTEKKNGNNGVFSELKKKLIEHLKELAPDLGLSLGNGNTSTSKGSPAKQGKEAKNVSEHLVSPDQAVTEVRNDAAGGAKKKLGRKENLGDIKEQLKDPDGKLPWCVKYLLWCQLSSTKFPSTKTPQCLLSTQNL